MLGRLTVHLPSDVVVLLLVNMSPEDIVSKSKVNRAFRIAAKSNLLWKIKYKQHFPHRDHTNSHFLNQFIAAYLDEYQHLTPGLRKLFSLVKEGDLSRIRAADLPFNMLSTKDKNGHSLLEWALNKKHQKLLNLFFEMAVRDFSDLNKKIIPSSHDADGNTLLHLAIMCNQPLATIKELIWLGCDISTNLGETGSHPIHIACIEGRLDIVKYLLKKNPALLNLVDRCGQSPLIHAVPHAAIVRFLAEQGCDLTLRTLGLPNRGNTALLWTAELGYTESLKALLDNNAALNVDNGYGSRMKTIHIACARGHLDYVKLLLERHPHLLNQLDNFEQTPLVWACAENRPEVIHHLIKCGANLMVKSTRNVNYPGYTPLHWAIKYGDKETVQLLLDHKVDITVATSGPGKIQSIHIACKKGRLAMTQLLLQKNHELLNAKDGYGQTPILWAASHGHPHMVRYLIKAGADLTASTQQQGSTYHGFQAIHWAAKNGNIETFQAFIDRKTDLTATTGQVQAIHIACKEGNFDIVALLLNTKPKLVNQVDIHGQTPLIWSAKKGNTSMMRMLLALKANINAVNHKGNTALHIAIQRKKLDAVKLLIKGKADIYALNHQGKRPIDDVPEEIQIPIELLTYSRRAKTKPDAKALSLFGKFGKQETLSAVKALRKVYFHHAQAETLKDHKKVLEHSEFRTLYHSFKSR